MSWIKKAAVPTEEVVKLTEVATDLYNACVSALNELKGEHPDPEVKTFTIQGLEEAIAKAEEVFHQ